jgi:hypothetical protein
MTRFDDPLFDPRLADWLEEDPSTAPDQALDVVLASFPSIHQRRAVRVPWRNRNMTSTLRLGLAAAVVVAAAVGGLYFLSSRTGPSVAAPETSPPAQSAPPSVAPSSTAANRTTFTSAQYGYSIEYPTPWSVVPATEVWTGDGYVGPEEPFVDRFFAPNSPTFVLIAAITRPEGATDEEFARGYQEQVAGRGCPVPLDAWRDATVGDVPARRAEFDCGGSQGVELIWIVGDTGYVMSGEPAVVDLMAETITVE